MDTIMNNPTIEFDGDFYRVYRHGFISGISANKAGALAHQAKLAARKTNHPDYRLEYPSRDGTGMPDVIKGDDAVNTYQQKR